MNEDFQFTPDPQSQLESPQPPLEQHPPQGPFWGYGDVAILIGLSIPCMLAGALVTNLAVSAIAGATPPRALEIVPAQIVGYLLILVVASLLFRMQYQRGLLDAAAWKSPGIGIPRLILWGVGLAVGLAMIGGLLRIETKDAPMMELLSDPLSLAVVAVFGITVGPLCEEIFFRGLLQPLLVKSTGVVAGIVLTGVLFGLVHLPQYGQSWQHGVLISTAGMAFGYARYAADSTLGSTVMHSAYNLVLFSAFIAARNAGVQA